MDWGGSACIFFRRSILTNLTVSQTRSDFSPRVCYYHQFPWVRRGKNNGKMHKNIFCQRINKKYVWQKI